MKAIGTLQSAWWIPATFVLSAFAAISVLSAFADGTGMTNVESLHRATHKRHPDESQDPEELAARAEPSFESRPTF